MLSQTLSYRRILKVPHPYMGTGPLPPSAVRGRTCYQCLNGSRNNPRESGERTPLDIQRKETAPDIILRLRDVLRRTGLSRATLYNRIAKNEFPHQISLGGTAVGWISREVESWIEERTLLRPRSATGGSVSEQHGGNAVKSNIHYARKEKPRSSESANFQLSVSNGSPDPAQLHLLGTKIYYDRSSGCFWLKLLTEF